MKKFIFSFMLIFAATAANAQQSIATYDVDIVQNQDVNDLVWNDTLNEFYGSLGSSPNGNSFAIFDPITKSLDTTIFVGTHPGPIAVSEDGYHAYIGNTANISKMKLSSRVIESTILLGPGLYAEDIAAVPGSEGSIAVSQRVNSGSPHYRGVVIYDNGVTRNDTTEEHTGLNKITFAGDPNELWGYGNESSNSRIFASEVDNSGIEDPDEYLGLTDAFGNGLLHYNGRLYTDNGSVIDISTGVPQLIAQVINESATMVTIDKDMGYIVYVYEGTDFTVARYDINTFVFIDKIEIDELSDDANAIICPWANYYIIATQDEEMVYIQGPNTLSTDEVSENEALLTVYPNPTSDQFSIDGANQINQVNIFNIAGLLVQSFYQQDSYNIVDLPSGTYFVTVTGEHFTKTEKIIKR